MSILNCFPPNIQQLSYRERLQKLNLLPINYWLELLDLVFFFQCMHGLVKLNISNFVSFNQGRTRRSVLEFILKPREPELPVYAILILTEYEE